MDNVSYVQGFAQASVIIHHPCFNCPSEQGVGGLEGCRGLPALQPVSLGLARAETGVGTLYICILGL